MEGTIYYDKKSDPNNPGWVAAAGGQTWQLDEGTPDELIAQAKAASGFYCNEEVTDWTMGVGR